MSATEKTIKIDAALLEEQRTWLIAQAKEGVEHADGILNLLEAIVDAAFDESPWEVVLV